MKKIRAVLTIDDGPCEERGKRLEFLNALGIEAVWFSLGETLLNNPECTDRLLKSGHILANHGYTHRAFSDMTLEECEEEIQKTDEIIEQCCRDAGVQQKHKLFRFPYGDKGSGPHYNLPGMAYTGEALVRKEKIQAMLAARGYEKCRTEGVVYHPLYEKEYSNDLDWSWTFDSNDYRCVDLETMSADPSRYAEILAAVEEFFLQNSGAVHIILIHDLNNTVEMFELIVNKCLEIGVEFVKMNEL